MIAEIEQMDTETLEIELPGKLIEKEGVTHFFSFKETLKKDTVYSEEDVFYNPYQNFIYKRAIFGLGVYTKEELELMHWDKKRRISLVSQRAQQVLNIWKQEIIIKATNRFFLNGFPKSLLTKSFIEVFTGQVDPHYINGMKFKDLGVTKKDIIDKLIKERILTNEFYKLKNVDYVKTSYGQRDPKTKKIRTRVS